MVARSVPPASRPPARLACAKRAPPAPPRSLTHNLFERRAARAPGNATPPGGTSPLKQRTSRVASSDRFWRSRRDAPEAFATTLARAALVSLSAGVIWSAWVLLISYPGFTVSHPARVAAAILALAMPLAVHYSAPSATAPSILAADDDDFDEWSGPRHGDSAHDRPPRQVPSIAGGSELL
jgi:hypothetical protein